MPKIASGEILDDDDDDDDDSPGPRPVGFAFYGLYPILIAAVRLFSGPSVFGG